MGADGTKTAHGGGDHLEGYVAGAATLERPPLPPGIGCGLHEETGASSGVSFEIVRGWLSEQVARIKDLAQDTAIASHVDELARRASEELSELEELLTMGEVAQRWREEMAAMFLEPRHARVAEIMRGVAKLVSGELTEDDLLRARRERTPDGAEGAAVPAAPAVTAPGGAGAQAPQPATERTRWPKRRRTRRRRTQAAAAAPEPPSLSQDERTRVNDTYRLRMLRAEAKGARAAKTEARTIEREAGITHRTLEQLLRRAHGGFAKDFAVRVLRSTPAEDTKGRRILAAELATLCPSAGSAKALLAVARGS